MEVLFGTNDPEHSTVAFRGVTRVYTSIAPKDDKTKYIKDERARDAGIVMTPTTNQEKNKNVKYVYIVEFFDDSEPMILPTDEFVMSFVNEKDLF